MVDMFRNLRTGDTISSCEKKAFIAVLAVALAARIALFSAIVNGHRKYTTRGQP